MKLLLKLLQSSWDFLSYFFGFPYEQQAKNLDLDKVDPTLRGPENPVSDRKIYRANKVSN